MFKIGEYVRCVESGRGLIENAAYRVERIFENTYVLEDIEGCFGELLFVRYVPRSWDYVRRRGAIFPDVFCLVRFLGDHSWIVVNQHNDSHTYVYDFRTGVIPVVHRAPYSEAAQKDIRSQQYWVHAPDCHCSQDAVADTCVRFNHYCENCDRISNPPFPCACHSLKPALEFKIPLGSTPTDERMRREREERRDSARADAKARLKDLGALDIHEQQHFCEKESAARDSYLALVGERSYAERMR